MFTELNKDFTSGEKDKWLNDNEHLTVEIDGNNIKTKDDLFIFLTKNMHFSEFWGYNWDALNETLTDLSWLQVNNITIVVHNLKSFLNCETEISKEIFFSILETSSLFWDKQIQKNTSGIIKAFNISIYN